MNNATRQHVLESAIKKYGSNQITKSIEEMAELTFALCKRNSVRGTDEESEKKKQQLNDNICEEIAEVQIMMEQMAIFFGKGKVDEWKEFKMQRLQKLISEEDIYGNSRQCK